MIKDRGGESLEDQGIIDLLFRRSEEAIKELTIKYSTHLRWIGMNILKDPGVTEECENDTYLRTWNSIPPERPEFLKAYLSRIMRNLALDRYRKSRAMKRNVEMDVLHRELLESIPDGKGDFISQDQEILKAVHGFLGNLDPTLRKLFVGRYFYGESVKSLSGKMGIKESAAATKLWRLRAQLREKLEKEEIFL